MVSYRSHKNVISYKNSIILFLFTHEVLLCLIKLLQHLKNYYFNFDFNFHLKQKNMKLSRI